jgi:hypothetical protein
MLHKEPTRAENLKLSILRIYDNMLLEIKEWCKPENQFRAHSSLWNLVDIFPILPTYHVTSIPVNLHVQELQQKNKLQKEKWSPLNYKSHLICRVHLLDKQGYVNLLHESFTKEKSCVSVLLDFLHFNIRSMSKTDSIDFWWWCQSLCQHMRMTCPHAHCTAGSSLNQIPTLYLLLTNELLAAKVIMRS